MKLGGRYKLLGKKKHAKLDIPCEEVQEIFEDALLDGGESTRLVGSYNSEKEVFKIEYKVSGRKKDIYENYCMLAEVRPDKDGGSKINYAFVYDRLMSWYTRIISLICFAFPLAAALTLYLKILGDFKWGYLAFYVPLLLISAFGLFSLFGYKEHADDVSPMVGEFERMLMTAFI